MRAKRAIVGRKCRDNTSIATRTLSWNRMKTTRIDYTSRWCTHRTMGASWEESERARTRVRSSADVARYYSADGFTGHQIVSSQLALVNKSFFFCFFFRDVKCASKSSPSRHVVQVKQAELFPLFSDYLDLRCVDERFLSPYLSSLLYV